MNREVDMCRSGVSRLLAVFIALSFCPLLTAGEIDPMDPAAGEFLDIDPGEYQLQALESYLMEDYLEAAEHYLRYLLSRPDDETAIYNLACCYGLMGEADLATAYLVRSVKSGFTDLEHIMIDPDFDPVRGSQVFIDAMTGITAEIITLRESAGQHYTFDAKAIRYCRLMLPDDFDPSLEYPLLIGLHGLGDNPEHFIGLWEGFENHDFIFAAPQALYPFPVSGDVGYSWFMADPATEAGYHSSMVAIDHVISLLDALERDFMISDVFLMGFSQGCTMTWNAGLTNPDRFDGLVGFGGWLDQGLLEEALMEIGPGCDVFVAHGIDDPVVPFEAGEETFTILSGMGCDAEFYAFEGGHTVDRITLTAAEEWMRSLR
jgi:phospholipase/carboxylesterase